MPKLTPEQHEIIRALIPHGSSCYPTSITIQKSDMNDSITATVEFKCSSSVVADRLWEKCHEIGHELSRPPEKPKDLSKFQALEGGDG